MLVPLTSQKKADAISTGVFLIALGVIAYLNAWWPGILLAVCVSLMTRQYLRARIYDLCLTSIIFGGLFIYFYLKVSFEVLTPVLFTVAGIYIIFREYFTSNGSENSDTEKLNRKVEELQQEINDVKREK